MAEIAPIANIVSYHAHIYFRDAAEREAALKLREEIAARFSVRLGRVWDKPVGPHEVPMYQVAFAVAEFPRLVPWLMLNRQGLSVLVHPNTASPRNDHLHGALWLGNKLSIVNPEQLPSLRDDEETDHLPVNTAPALEP